MPYAQGAPTSVSVVAGETSDGSDRQLRAGRAATSPRVQEDDLSRRKVNGVGVVKRGRGRPFTLFAPGGQGEDLETRMWYAHQVKGTKIGFAYEDSEYVEPLARIRREAERDAAEARAVASEHHVTQAIGFSRGARAVVGALAEDPALFKRVALVIPPGGSAAGKYSDWLSSLTSAGRDEMAAENPRRRHPRRPRAPGPSGTNLGRTARRPIGDPPVPGRLHGPRASDEPSRRVLC